jgi:hypothetical protein
VRGSSGGAAWLADTGASHSKQAAQLSRGLLCLLCACGVPGLGGAVPENGGLWWRCYMECGIFVATVFVGVLEFWV